MFKLFYSVIFAFLFTNISHLYSDTYNSPKPYENLFSFSIEDLKLGQGIKKEELLESGQAGVKFFDDFGKLVSFEWAKIPNEYKTLPETQIFQTAANNTYGTLKSALPQITLIKVEPYYINGIKVLELLFDCPKGSTLVIAETRERLDSIRGVLLFRNGDWLYSLTVMKLKDPQAVSTVETELRRIFEHIKINAY